MSRLFELYVYSNLEAAYHEQILFQVSGYGQTKADYIHKGEKIIIDAKYKLLYDKGFELADIREISGYSRDIEILKYFGQDYIDSNQETKCLIIYPKVDSKVTIKSNESLWNLAEDINEYRNFRKLAIKVPIKDNQQI